MSIRQSWREWRRLRRPLPPAVLEAPVPPPLPPGRIVNVPGRGEMFVREQDGPADGPTLLLLHGWTVSADLNWWTVYDALRDVGRVIAIDHRGHGRGIRTEETFRLEDCADDAAALLEVLGVDRVVAVGYSMGGPISMLLWRQHPERVAGLVFQATALEWRATWSERMTWKLMGLFERYFHSSRVRLMIDRMLREAIEMRPALAAHRSWFKAELSRGEARSIGDAGRALGDYDARPFAGDVDVPVAVVVTTEDRLVRPKKQRALAKATRGTVFELASDHDACFVDGDDFAVVTNASVRSVLDRIGPVRQISDRSA